jgi:hypothetical protein
MKCNLVSSKADQSLRTSQRLLRWSSAATD